MTDIRDVPLEDVSWKVQATGTKQDGEMWCLWVAYADARIYGERLDAWLGEFGWSDQYKVIDVAGAPGIECRISLHLAVVERVLEIYPRMEIGKGEVQRHGWAEIDVGGREQVKGAESDAFKRAGGKCGIGRNLYKLPKLFSIGVKGKDDQVVAPRFVGDLTIDEWLQEELTRQIGE